MPPFPERTGTLLFEECWLGEGLSDGLFPQMLLVVRIVIEDNFYGKFSMQPENNFTGWSMLSVASFQSRSVSRRGRKLNSHNLSAFMSQAIKLVGRVVVPCSGTLQRTRLPCPTCHGVADA